jgi:hypothetical protein
VQNWSLYSSILLSCTSFWQITLSRYTFFKLFPQIRNQRKILHFLDTHMLKKKQKIFGVMEYIYEYFWEIVECKFARNGLTNWKTFLTNILKNIIWHLFVGESHQAVKITVPYWAYESGTGVSIEHTHQVLIHAQSAVPLKHAEHMHQQLMRTLSIRIRNWCACWAYASVPYAYALHVRQKLNSA